MSEVQPGILAPVPAAARALSFDTVPNSDLRRSLAALRETADGETAVVGVGLSLARALDRKVPGLHEFPVHAGAGFDVPATPAALWCWPRGADRGDLVHLTRRVERALAPGFSRTAVIDAFRYGSGLDLTGYEDGTENPKDEDAVAAAVVSGQGAGLDGGSFVAVQQWVHDIGAFAAMSPGEQDNTIGRRRADNGEIDDAPASANVKRTAQESFDPAAFVLRRSMPWAQGAGEGLVFVAIGKSLNTYEAQLRRMCGAEDGVTDALFRFTRPVTGAYFFCPPLAGGRLDLTVLGL